MNVDLPNIVLAVVASWLLDPLRPTATRVFLWWLRWGICINTMVLIATAFFDCAPLVGSTPVDFVLTMIVACAYFCLIIVPSTMFRAFAVLVPQILLAIVYMLALKLNASIPSLATLSLYPLIVEIVWIAGAPFWAYHSLAAIRPVTTTFQ